MGNNITAGIRSILPALNRSGMEVFSLADVIRLTGLRRAFVLRALSVLKRKGRLIGIERGSYLYTPEGFEKNWSGDSFVIASHLAAPYALAYWTALNHWKFTEQISSTVFIQTTKKKFHARKTILGVTYKCVVVSSRKFFGSETIWTGVHQIRMTDREKTIVDCLDRPDYCGGILEPAKALIGAIREKSIDMKKIVRYIDRLGNSTVAKRMGYILEAVDADPDNRTAPALRGMIGAGYSLFDPSLPAIGPVNIRWRLRVNIPEGTFDALRRVPV